MGYPYMHGFGGWGWIAMILGFIFWTLLIVAVVFLIIRLARHGGRYIPHENPTSPGGDQSARDIVQMRYARGEINRDEYLKLMEDLK
jgi:putative membrane protein